MTEASQNKVETNTITGLTDTNFIGYEYTYGIDDVYIEILDEGTGSSFFANWR